MARGFTFMLSMVLGLMPLTGLAQENGDAEEKKTEAEKKYEDALFYEGFEELNAGDYPPLDFLVLDGDFIVQGDEENKWLELPATPLNTFGAIFGPSQNVDVMVSAQIKSQARRRSMPRFGIGLCGVNGYKLRVTPAKQSVELFLGNEVVASETFEWESEEWTHLVLQIRQTGDAKWVVEGSAWIQGKEMPEEWLIHYETEEEPINGKPSIWGTPYSSYPILYDHILVDETKDE